MKSIIELDRVCIDRSEKRIVDSVSWVVKPGEHWVVLGANGSGKTTLLQVASARVHPSAGVATVLGARLGRVDVRSLRARIAHVSGALVRSLDASQTVREVVLSGKRSVLTTVWDTFDESDYLAASELMGQFDLEPLALRRFDVISEGERQRTMLASALMAAPELMLLDEPFAGLDLGAREQLLVRLTKLHRARPHLPTVLVTHHLEEIPMSTTHALLLRNGMVVAGGSVDDVLTGELVSETFGLAVAVERHDGRWSARVFN